MMTKEELEQGAFDNTVFKLNDNLTHEHVNVGPYTVLVVDDFYEDFDAATAELEKLPLTVTKLNNEWIFDARLSYAANMSGTELPYVNEWRDRLLTIVGYEGKNYTDYTLIVNAVKIFDPKLLDDYYYNIHIDAPEEADRTIATIVFLNDHYEEGEGLNFYPDDPNNLLGNGLFFPKDRFPMLGYIQGKPNRAVSFLASDRIRHGSALATDQFQKEMRYTQIIFTKLL